MQLHAIASLDGQYPAVIRTAPSFNLDKIRIPILDMPSINNSDKRVMLDSMRFAQRYKVHFDSVRHREFYQFQRIAHPEQSENDIPYKVIARYTKAFLNGILKNDKEALHFLKQDPEDAGAPSNFMRTGFVPAIGSPPTENEFLWLVREGKITEARQIFQEVSKQLPDYKICNESFLQTIAFFYRRDHGAEASVEVFELWSDMFPDSWRAKNQLGNTYSQVGNNQAAIRSYTETIKLIRQDKGLSKEEKTDYLKQLNGSIKELKEG